MARSSPLLRLACVVIAGLVLSIAVEAPGASLRIFWRFAVLSFDSPATQLADELACESSPTSQAGEVDQYTRLTAGASGRLGAASAAPRRTGLALSSGITRAPPTA